MKQPSAQPPSHSDAQPVSECACWKFGAMRLGGCAQNFELVERRDIISAWPTTKLMMTVAHVTPVNFTVNFMNFTMKLAATGRKQSRAAPTRSWLVLRRKMQQARNFDRNFAGSYNRVATFRGFDYRPGLTRGPRNGSSDSWPAACTRSPHRQDRRMQVSAWGPHCIPLEAVGRLGDLSRSGCSPP
jgi:hypothetical protein